MENAALKKLVFNVALNDDHLAYKRLFLYYHPKLLSFSLAITQCKESAEEVVSDVFLNIWKLRKSLVKIDNPHLYLYISTKNISLNYLAKQKRDRVLPIDSIKTEFSSLYFDPESLMITSEMFKRICNAIGSLPPRCQLIFKLIKEDNFAYKDVAVLLNLSIKTIEAQMTIALRKLGQSICLREAATA